MGAGSYAINVDDTSTAGTQGSVLFHSEVAEKRQLLVIWHIVRFFAVAVVFLAIIRIGAEIQPHLVVFDQREHFEGGIVDLDDLVDEI